MITTAVLVRFIHLLLHIFVKVGYHNELGYSYTQVKYAKGGGGGGGLGDLEPLFWLGIVHTRQACFEGLV